MFGAAQECEADLLIDHMRKALALADKLGDSLSGAYLSQAFESLTRQDASNDARSKPLPNRSSFVPAQEWEANA
jgi:hypothetical protein